MPPGDCCGGNGDSLPALPPLLLGLVLGLPPELGGEDDGGVELGGCDVDVEDVAQPARAVAQATANTSLTMSR